jgi:hypothetical protein
MSAVIGPNGTPMRWIAEMYTTPVIDKRPKEILVCADADVAVQVAEFIVREMKRNPFTEMGRKITEANSYDPREQADEWNALPWYAKFGGPPDYGSIAAGKKAAAYALWAQQVGPKCQWDHKPRIRKMLEEQGGKKLFKLGWHKYGQHDYYFDIWSNIHYGCVGTAIGFCRDELIDGAGVAQIGSDVYEHIKKREWPTTQNHVENGPWPASADDIPDNISVRLGIDLFATAKPGTLTTRLLLRSIAAVPLPWGKGQDHAKELHRCSR